MGDIPPVSPFTPFPAAHPHRRVWQEITDRTENSAGTDWRDAEIEKYYGSEDASSDLDELFEILAEYSPPYAYFGAIEGDGADYGFWPCVEELMTDRDRDEVLDLDNLPEFVAEVNDHGNVSLYRREHLEYKLVWAIV